LATAIPISIAFVAILGAVIGWRAERHASTAGEYDQAALTASVISGNEYTDASFQAQLAENQFEHWVQLGMDGGAQLGSACRDGSAGTGLANVSGLAAVMDQSSCELQQLFSSYHVAAYDGSLPSHAFNFSKYVSDVAQFAQYSEDANVASYAVSADHERHTEWLLLLLSLAAGAALIFCTLAQLALHHVWKSTHPLALAFPGWLLAALCAVVVTVLEV
jgi:hypothetical protein